MIRSITVINHLNESLKIELVRPELSGLAVKKIEGLGPVQANINLTKLATADGGLDNSARLDSRNLVFSFIFLEHPTIEDTRLLTYRYFPIKRNVTIVVETDRRICRATGRVENNEPSIFDKLEGCQISILCPNPYFQTEEEEEETLSGVEALFEFPFENDSLTEPLLEFGEIYTRTEGTVYYEGDAETGFTIRIHSLGVVSGLVIYNINTREAMRINDEKLIAIAGSGIKAGDDIVIITEKGKKSITLIREGTEINILNALEKPIKWFQLYKGDNLFAFIAETGVTNLMFKIDYTTLYEGV